jgi:hypothetical protein
LTALRALLLVAIDRYLERARLLEVREGISELEIQKLAYFLQLGGAPLQLKFVRGRYGPYSDRLTHVLNVLEGHHLTGLGDRSARVAELVPINPTPGGVPEAEKLLAELTEFEPRLESLLNLINGFETPYSLELLATVHFAATQSPPTSSADEISQRVAKWSLRKARLFTPEHVATAAQRLNEHHLMPV